MITPDLMFDYGRSAVQAFKDVLVLSSLNWAVLDELDRGMHQRWLHLSSQTHFQIVILKFRVA
jgi:hypothetical protein